MITDAILLYVMKPSNKEISSLVKETLIISNNFSLSDTDKFFVDILENIYLGNTKTKKQIKFKLLKYEDEVRQLDRYCQSIFDIFINYCDIEKVEDEDSIDTLIISLRNSISAIKVSKELSSLYRDNYKLYSSRQDITSEINENFRTTMNNIDDIYIKNSEQTIESRIVENIDMTSEEDIDAAFETNRKRKVDGSLRHPLKAFNIMCGSNNGSLRGETCVFYALKECGKSLILKITAAGIPIYNKNPTLINSNKKPLILFVSLENEAYQNAVYIYKLLYMQFIGDDIDKIPLKDLKIKVRKFLHDTGWRIQMMRCQPRQYNFDFFRTNFQYYESKGYEICAVINDYLSKGAESITNMSRYEATYRLFSDHRNYCADKGASFFTGAQLNPAAIPYNVVNNRVKEFRPDMIATCKDIAKEADLEVYLDIERNHLNEKYWMFRRDKHRIDEVAPVPLKYQFFAYKFTPSGIIFDCDSPNNRGFTRDIYQEKQAYQEVNQDDTISSDQTF